MNIQLLKGSLQNTNADLLVLVCWQQKEGDTSHGVLQRDDGGVAIDKQLGGKITNVIRTEEWNGELGSVKLIDPAGAFNARYIVLLGAGERAKATPNTWRRIAVCLSKTAEAVKAQSCAITAQSGKVAAFDLAARAQALVEGLFMGAYRFDAFKPAKDRKPLALQTVYILHDGTKTELERALAKAELLATAQCRVRDLVNTPSNICTPQYLADTARKIARAGKLTCRVLGRDALVKERMGIFLSVAQASGHEPQLLHLQYTPRGKPKQRVALVGKGVTFDSGGYDIKPSKSMGDMKNDMAGAATVLEIMRVMSILAPKIAIDAYAPCTENMIDRGAFKSSDIFTARNGKTIEIVNTDAEGRLVLADTLDFACDQKPDLIIDIATLTGGVKYALGELYTAVLGNSQKDIDALIAISKATGEHMWQLPLEEEYLAGFKGGPASLRNCGRSGASTVTGALFLAQFVRDIPWIHLDIAEGAWNDDERWFAPKGGTGIPLRTVCEFLLQR